MRIFQLVGELAGGLPPIERYQHHAGTDCTEQHRVIEVAVAPQVGNTLAGTQATAIQFGGEGVAVLFQSGVAQGLAPLGEDQRRSLGVALSAASGDVADPQHLVNAAQRQAFGPCVFCCNRHGARYPFISSCAHFVCEHTIRIMVCKHKISRAENPHRYLPHL
ncbi:hypothetical protein D9M70_576250 [compost metagenome]